MLPAEYSDSDAARGEHKRRKVRKRRRGERESRAGEKGESREGERYRVRRVRVDVAVVEGDCADPGSDTPTSLPPRGVGVDVGAAHCDCAAVDEHPSALPKRKVLTFGQFREVSSAGGVGRKCQESSKGEHLHTVGVIKGDAITRESISNQSVPGSFFRRGA